MPTLPTTAPPRPFKALLVEDSATQMALLRAVFRSRGHEVMEARNGAEALLVLAGEMPDLVVSDCYMPLIDGYQLCRLLKDDRATRHLPVLLLTAETRGLGHFWAKTCGADRFIVKEPEMDGVLEAAEDLIRTAPPKDPAQGPVFRNPEDLGVEAIQRRLARALEQRLLETTLRIPSHGSTPRTRTPKASSAASWICSRPPCYPALSPSSIARKKVSSPGAPMAAA